MVSRRINKKLWEFWQEYTRNLVDSQTGAPVYKNDTEALEAALKTQIQAHEQIKLQGG